MSAMASQITGASIVFSTVGSGADKKKTQKPRVTGLCVGNSIVGTRRGTIHSLAITSRSWPGPGFNRTFHRKTSRRLEAARLVVYIITSLWNATGANGIFKCISLNEIICILIRISLKFVPTVPIDNKWTLVQVMAWRRTGDKPLSELMLTQFADVYMRH